MRLSAKIEYACRAVMELSKNYSPEALVQIAYIAKAQGLSKNFLMQILIRLKGAGIVESARGVAGGYSLSRPPSQIRVADVVRAIDEGLMEYQKTKRLSKAPDSAKAIIMLWNEVNKEVVSRLESVSFEDLLTQAAKGRATYEI